MYCLKCGRDTGSDNVFCVRCLTEMEKHPIKPGTAINLPSQNPADAPMRPVRYRMQTAEEQVQRLTRQVRGLSFLLIVLALLFAMVSAVLIYTLQSQKPALAADMGRNYTAVPTDND